MNLPETTQTNDSGKVAASGRRLSITLASILLGVSLTLGVCAQGYVEQRAKVKAAYLYQFIKYVQWPESTFEDRQSPLVIGVIGEDPVNSHLRLICREHTAGSRHLRYQKVTTLEQAMRCHILFVSDDVPVETVDTIIPGLATAPVLLVGENDGFLDAGGVISFVTIANNVRLEISIESAESRRLKISSQLAKLARVVNE